MFIELTITWVPLGFSGYIWLDTKNCVKKTKKNHWNLFAWLHLQLAVSEHDHCGIYFMEIGEHRGYSNLFLRLFNWFVILMDFCYQFRIRNHWVQFDAGLGQSPLFIENSQSSVSWTSGRETSSLTSSSLLIETFFGEVFWTTLFVDSTGDKPITRFWLAPPTGELFTGSLNESLLLQFHSMFSLTLKNSSKLCSPEDNLDLPRDGVFLGLSLKVSSISISLFWKLPMFSLTEDELLLLSFWL